MTDKVELLRQPAHGDEPAGWLARIGGAVFPVSAVAVGIDGDGETAHVTLEVPASTVRIGERSDIPPGTPTAGRLDRLTRLPWGTPSPDPREAIPGWTPPADMTLGHEVARPEGGQP